MDENSACRLLKKHRISAELSMKSDLKWFATKLNTEKFPVLNDNLAQRIKSPLDLLQPHDKATLMFDELLDWVKGNPTGLDDFVKILKLEPVRYKVLIEKLDSSK
jgi:hypothetical protein